MTSPRRFRLVPALAAVAACALAAPAFAIQTCDLDGAPVNPDNGNTTAGKSGLMRCRDASTGVVAREQELRGGKFMGAVRYFKGGQLEREFSVDERGNRNGVSREWNIDAGGQRTLVREETMRDSHSVGLVKTWYPTGQRRRLTFYGDDQREQAVAEFTGDGRLYDLRCGPKPLFGAEFDDKAACGFAGTASTVQLYGGKGQLVSRVTYDKGEKRKTETLWDSGSVRELRETTATGTLERRFAADGTRLNELQWVSVPARQPAAADARPRSVKVLEQEFHTSGQLVHETRWAPDERAGALIVSESRWYLNGQPKEREEYADAGGSRTRHETDYFDSGKPSSEGTWIVGGSGASFDRSERPTGTHRGFDEKGRVRSESVYDDKGRITRERQFDESGALTRDDEVFEDGPRKSRSR